MKFVSSFREGYTADRRFGRSNRINNGRLIGPEASDGVDEVVVKGIQGD